MHSIIKKFNQFGLFTFLICSMSRLMRILHFPRQLIHSYVKWKNNYLSFWLWKRFKNVVVSEVPTSQDLDDGYVFVFWLQGEHKAPQ